MHWLSSSKIEIFNVRLYIKKGVFNLHMILKPVGTLNGSSCLIIFQPWPPIRAPHTKISLILEVKRYLKFKIIRSIVGKDNFQKIKFSRDFLQVKHFHHRTEQLNMNGRPSQYFYLEVVPVFGSLSASAHILWLSKFEEDQLKLLKKCKLCFLHTICERREPNL